MGDTLATLGLFDTGDGLAVWRIACLAALEGVEIGLSLRVDRVGVTQIAVIHALDKFGVATGNLRRVAELLD